MSALLPKNAHASSEVVSRQLDVPKSLGGEVPRVAGPTKLWVSMQERERERETEEREVHENSIPNGTRNNYVPKININIPTSLHTAVWHAVFKTSAMERFI